MPMTTKIMTDSHHRNQKKLWIDCQITGIGRTFVGSRPRDCWMRWWIDLCIDHGEAIKHSRYYSHRADANHRWIAKFIELDENCAREPSNQSFQGSDAALVNSTYRTIIIIIIANYIIAFNFVFISCWTQNLLCHSRPSLFVGDEWERTSSIYLLRRRRGMERIENISSSIWLSREWSSWPIHVPRSFVVGQLVTNCYWWLLSKAKVIDDWPIFLQFLQFRWKFHWN